jgi:hypothetical protein
MSFSPGTSYPSQDPKSLKSYGFTSSKGPSKCEEMITLLNQRVGETLAIWRGIQDEKDLAETNLATVKNSARFLSNEDSLASVEGLQVCYQVTKQSLDLEDIGRRLEEANKARLQANTDKYAHLYPCSGVRKQFASQCTPELH